MRTAGKTGGTTVAKLARHLTVGLLLALIALLGLLGERWQPRIWDVLGPKEPLVVYFASPDAQRLVGVRRWVTPGEATPSKALELLIAGSPRSDLISPVPPQALLLRLEIRDGTAWADFSHELVSHHSGGSAGEILTVYAIVTTLTEFPEVQQVMILVEGQVRETLVGHLDLSRPIQRDDTLLSSRVLDEPW